MANITKEQYEFALARIEELLPLVDDNIPANDKRAVELAMMSDIVITYEKEHYPNQFISDDIGIGLFALIRHRTLYSIRREYS